MFETALKSWPIILLFAVVIGTVMAWFATRHLRKLTNEAQAQMISVYQQTITAKYTLALTLADAHGKQITLLTAERKDSDARHENVIAEYRANMHAVRNELQECTNKKSDYMAELADLRARTDFKPVMDFLQDENRKSTEVLEHITDILAVIAPVLERVMESLRTPSDTARKVEVVNTPAQRIPVEHS